MKFYLLSDNIDTVMGMRLAGVPGEVLHEEDEVRSALAAAMEAEDTGVILITQKLVSLCRDYIYDLKLNRARPLIVEIPDRHGGAGVSDAMLGYVREAVGIKL